MSFEDASLTKMDDILTVLTVMNQSIPWQQNHESNMDQTDDVKQWHLYAFAGILLATLTLFHLIQCMLSCW